MSTSSLSSCLLFHFECLLRLALPTVDQVTWFYLIAQFLNLEPYDWVTTFNLFKHHQRYQPLNVEQLNSNGHMEGRLVSVFQSPLMGVFRCCGEVDIDPRDTENCHGLWRQCRVVRVLWSGNGCLSPHGHFCVKLQIRPLPHLFQNCMR